MNSTLLKKDKIECYLSEDAQSALAKLKTEHGIDEDLALALLQLDGWTDEELYDLS